MKDQGLSHRSIYEYGMDVVRRGNAAVRALWGRLVYVHSLLCRRAHMGKHLLFFFLMIAGLQVASTALFIAMNAEFSAMYAAIQLYQFDLVYSALRNILICGCSFNLVKNFAKWWVDVFAAAWITALERSFLADITEVLAYAERQHNPMGKISNMVSALTRWCTAALIRGSRVLIELAVLLMGYPYLMTPLLILLAGRFVLDGALMLVPVVVSEHVHGLVAQEVDDAISKKEVLVSASGERLFQEAVEEKINKRSLQVRSSLFYDGVRTTLSQCVDMLSYCYLVFSQLRPYTQGLITKDALFLNLKILIGLLPDLHGLIRSFHDVRKAYDYLGHLESIDGSLQWMRHKKGAMHPCVSSEISGLLELKGLHIMGKDFHFKIKNWSIEPGARLHIIGPNGSGKSTLMCLISQQILGVEASEVSLAPTSRCYYQEVEGGMSYAPGVQILFRPSKSDQPCGRDKLGSLLYPLSYEELSPQDKDDANYYLEHLGLPTLSEALHGCSAHADETSKKGSSGEMQIWMCCGFYIQLCRAVRSQDTQVLLILDESFSNMDQLGLDGGKKQKCASLLLERLRKRDAAIIIDHDRHTQYEGFVQSEIGSIVTDLSRSIPSDLNESSVCYGCA